MTDVELDARVSALEDNTGVNLNDKVLSKQRFCIPSLSPSESDIVLSLVFIILFEFF